MVTVGGESTWMVTGLVDAEPYWLVITALYSLPSIPGEQWIVSVGDVAPLMFVNVEPPLGADCHWTVIGDVPVNPTVSVTVVPATHVMLGGGGVVMTGGEPTVVVDVVAVVVDDVVDAVVVVVPVTTGTVVSTAPAGAVQVMLSGPTTTLPDES